LPPVECTQASRLVILKPEIGQDLGILVEEGGDIAHVRSDQIESATASDETSGEAASLLVAGICKFESELMILVDPKRMTEAVTKLFDVASR
jgi:chemotaxis signal transduction protein